MDDYLSKPCAVRRSRTSSGASRLQPAGAGADAGAVVFDPALLQEIGDVETEVALATMFLDQSAERLPAMHDAITSDDPDRLHRLAHGLKGSAATVGAARMSEVAKALCDIASAGGTAGTLQLHAELTDALAQTRTAPRRPHQPRHPLGPRSRRHQTG